ncbi:hypothetical protein ACNVED_09735 [Legionella sp. D16C41]|uniref:hypothetical protein n=1 Tax=Legionella sp. D16C41 TaxID=3402688 RepID=UPI003AF75F00
MQAKNEVQDFLVKNYHFQEMKRIASNSGNTGHRKIVSFLEKCDSFDNYLIYSRDLDTKITNNLVAYNIGRDNVNRLLYVSGFFSNKYNFTYHEFHLRENIVAYLDKKQLQMV